ncbi:MAG: WD40/YVTN/BNR-like repeat-containing protein, partial [Ktedonobacteraceae bacterium]
MKIQETDNTGQQVTPSVPSQPKRNRWLAGIGAVIVVILLVGLSTLLFAQLRQHQATQTSPTPPTGRWQQVLKGYTLISITAVRSDPAIVYACVARGTSNGTTQSNTSTFTILRSADFGDHWQDIGKNVIAGETCQIAVNSANSDDIYTVSYGNSMPDPAQLKHSQDGGKTWETILPLMHV